MAAHLRIAASFKISRTLFTKDDGSPYQFFYENESDDLRCIIRKGLGCLVNDPAAADILLCEKKTDNRITQGYLPLDFIVDCVKRNAFLNINTYRANTLGLKASASKGESSNSHAHDRDDSEEENLLKFSQPVRIRVKSNGLSGRKKYSDSDDFKIIQYLIRHEKYAETGGNVVWKQMELVKVTEHTYQSMKARFLKKIRPEIDTYTIPEIWKAKLRGDYADDDDDDDDEVSYAEKTFNYINMWNDDLKENSNKKRSVLSAEGDQRNPSSGSSTKTVVNDQSSAATEKQSVASPLNKHSSAACSCNDSAANQNGSDLEPVAAGHSDQLIQVQTENDDGDRSRPDDLDDSILLLCEVDADMDQGTQGADYIYDDMDCLILSEADKCQNLDGADKISNQSGASSAGVTTRRHEQLLSNFSCDETQPVNSKVVSSHVNNNREERNTTKDRVVLNIHFDSAKTNSSSEREDRNLKKHSNQSGASSAGVTTRRHEKVMNNFSCDEIQPVNSEMVSSHANDNREKRNTTKDRVVLNIHFDSAKTNFSPQSEDKNLKKHRSSDQHKVTSDKVVEVSKEHVNSVNTILNIIEKGPAKSKNRTNSLLSKNHNSEVKDVESDTCHRATSLRTKAAMQNRKSRSISPVVQSEHVLTRRIRQEERIDENNVNVSVDNSPKTVHKETATRKGSVSQSHSVSDDSVEETSLHMTAPKPNEKCRHISPLVNKSDEMSPKTVDKNRTSRKGSDKKSHSYSEDSVEETSEQHSNSPRRLLSTKSSKLSKRALESEESDDVSNSNASCSQRKNKRLQQCYLARPSTESSRLRNTVLTSPPGRVKEPNRLSKKETLSLAKRLSKVCQLPIQEAALLLKYHHESYKSALRDLDFLRN